MEEKIEGFDREGMVNVVGGWWGYKNENIREIEKEVEKYEKRKKEKVKKMMRI